jgi:hypothetical protein
VKLVHRPEIDQGAYNIQLTDKSEVRLTREGPKYWRCWVCGWPGLPDVWTCAKCGRSR